MERGDAVCEGGGIAQRSGEADMGGAGDAAEGGVVVAGDGDAAGHGFEISAGGVALRVTLDEKVALVGDEGNELFGKIKIATEVDRVGEFEIANGRGDGGFEVAAAADIEGERDVAVAKIVGDEREVVGAFQGDESAGESQAQGMTGEHVIDAILHAGAVGKHGVADAGIKEEERARVERVVVVKGRRAVALKAGGEGGGAAETLFLLAGTVPALEAAERIFGGDGDDLATGLQRAFRDEHDRDFQAVAQRCESDIGIKTERAEDGSGGLQRGGEFVLRRGERFESEGVFFGIEFCVVEIVGRRGINAQEGGDFARKAVGVGGEAIQKFTRHHEPAGMGPEHGEWRNDEKMLHAWMSHSVINCVEKQEPARRRRRG